MASNDFSDREFIEALEKFGSDEEPKKYSDDEIKRIVSEGFNWNRPLTLALDDVWHPLHFAVRYLNIDAVYFLLELGADPNLAPVVDGRIEMSPLQYAKTLASGDNGELEAGNFETKEIVYILENHLKISEELSGLPSTVIEIEIKIDEINRQISNAQGINRQLKKIEASVRDMAKPFKELEQIEQRENGLSEERLEKGARISELKSEEGRLSKEKREKEASLVMITWEMKRLSDEKKGKEDELKRIEHEERHLSKERRWSETELEMTKRKENSLSTQKKAKEAELKSIRNEKIAQLTAERDALSSKESYMSEGHMFYQRHLLKRLHKKRDDIVMKLKQVCRDLECVMCLNVPKTGNIYTCAECGQLMCSVCAPQVKRCPMCRQDFEARPFIRNRALERIARKLTV